MLWVPVRRRNGRPGRWFLVGMHRKEEGLRQFLSVADEFRGREAVIVFVRSTLDRATGRFHDRIIRAKGTVPAIDRHDMEWLVPAARRQLAGRLPQRRRARDDDSPPPLPRPAAQPPPRRSVLLSGAVVAVLVLAAAAMLGALPR